ncbi:DUF2946 family protein [Eleftheria terrae]|uniref:DUF2946 family protein n=1 Tax=Eleftheria terrae TaxID=1597781 RepID=UPI00263AB667|nr:DUF2946 family protein [Eleftheria terrae]WKB53379.1 hypothetical protein N7L95_02985 [Eleftheria terrae]
MPPPPSPLARPPGRRLALALWLALVMFWQPWVAAYQASLAAAGIEVCTATGVTRVHPKEQPAGEHQGHDQDCCCSAGLVAALPPVPAPLPRLHAIAPTAHLGERVLQAEWLGPLSRGPPRHT